MRQLLSICLLFSSLFAVGQKTVAIEVFPTIGGKKVAMGKVYKVDGATFQLHVLKAYFGYSKQYHLVDVSHKSSLKWDAIVAKGDLTFGADSAVNTAGVGTGDLDPQKGMYWTWQTGYVNFKLEGVLTLADGSIKEVTYHLGGYRYPYATSRVLSKLQNSDRITIGMELEPLVSRAIEGKEKLMKPGAEAVELTNIIVEGIQVK